MNSFIYLDEYKMYSISAQIFGGLTESVVEFSTRGRSKSEDQKGPIGSGRLLADIVSEQSGTQEKKFLHDYAYTLFEQKLREDKKLLELTNPLDDDFKNLIGSAAFIKVTGKALFSDVPQLVDLMKQFNSIGEALTYITTTAKISEIKNTAEQDLENVRDRNKKAALRQQISNAANIKKLAKESGLQQDPKFLEHLSYLLTYMMKDEFELQVSLATTDGPNVSFHSPLNRESLKESCSAIIRKYSRKCEEPLTLVGMVTQGKETTMPVDQPQEGSDSQGDPANFRQALLALVDATATMEESFFGKLPNEFVIDPVAVFRQL